MKIFLILFILFGLVGSAFPQEKQKIPADFFIGRWAGTVNIDNEEISVGWDGGRVKHWKDRTIWSIKMELRFFIPEEVEKFMKIYGKQLLEQTGRLNITGTAIVQGQYNYIHFPVECGLECRNSGEKTKNYPSVKVLVSGEYHKNDSECYILLDFEGKPKDYDIRRLKLRKPEEIEPFETVNFNVSEKEIVYDFKHKEQADCGDFDFNTKVVLNKIQLLEKSFPKDIKPNEPIKTDKRTRIEVTLPNVGKVNIAENTQAVFKSENLLEIVKGKLQGFIDKLKPQTKFNVNTPTSIVGVRGTEYQIEVEDDGTTTLFVLDGEVEISDLDKKKTVIVKKNQKSIVKPGKLPSEPENINPEQILEWWK